MATNRTIMLIMGIALGAGAILAAVLCGVLIDNSDEPVFAPITSDGYVEIRHGEDVVLSGQVGVQLDGDGVECSSGGENVIQCYEWEKRARLEVQREVDDDVTCQRFIWQAMTADVVLYDCYELGDDQWFGSANRFFQHWPINEWNESMTMYVSGDMYANYNDYGSVLERYWLSSKGVAIRASHNSPLHVSVNYNNDGLVCFKGEYKGSYYPSTSASPNASLDYRICTGENTRVIHDYMTERFVKKPTGLPDTRMMASPIWSTWARFKTAVNQSLVLGFADEILANDFSNSQIEIDDGYAGLNYGDFFFDPEKFPDPVAMIQELHDKNFRVTLWVTPFANWNTEAFTEGDENGYWVKNEDGTTALIRWWAGLQAGMLDVTNPAAVTWFVNRLEQVRTDYGIDSFKFDAGETNYLGHHKTMEPIVNPCEYTTGWVKVAAQLGTQVEVRVGFETQNQPIFVRMMDKDSNWGWNNGLKTLITSALTFSVLGYPYVLADMIGGNVYEGGFRETYLPDKELFIRWLQITAFMPSMQYSISPWQYEDDPEVVEISRRWTSFHENVITPILIGMAKTEAIPEGKPMIRPLWWIAPSDRDALISDDQFLVGDDILVAPIVENGTFSRHVYLPAGRWVNAIDGITYDGGQWLTNVPVPLEEALYYTREGITLPVPADRNIQIRHDGEVVLKGQLGTLLGNSAFDCSGGDGVDQCFEWSSKAQLHIQSENDGDVECHHYNWQAMTTDVILQDCYQLGDDQWFGSANRFFQHWPINEWNESMTMYVSGDMYANYNDYGSTLERYWLSSKGVAVRASHDSPLHVSVNYDNDNLVCFRGEFGSSYYPNPDNDPAFLNYTICTGENTRVIHDYMTERFVKKPTGLPDTRMMGSPIWSTWARFKTAVNQSLVLGFADEILANDFSNSQIEIDDGYAGLNYGDFFFDPEKFPDPVAMIQELHDKNFRVTLWVTPFANWNTEAFTEGDENGYWVKNEDGTTALIRWWAGLQAGMLDVTNPAAVTWFVNRLEEVRTVYGIDSFKFDAGETNYLGYHKTMEPIVNPCEYTTSWVKVAAQLGTQVEVRVGFETQNQPIFVRMMDKDSKWGWDNGLKTLITSALTFSVLGYPYVLADMIGGNVYEGGFRETYLPDKELFIRWLQITAFMPSMQYSISPWQYEDDPEVVNISRRWTSFHENVITPILIDLAETEAIPEGKPMIRPLWWIAPSDRDALISDDQFLVGDDILVAPIVENGTFSRDVYLPAGRWVNAIDGNTYDGGQWLRDVQVPLEEALYYTREGTTLPVPADRNIQIFHHGEVVLKGQLGTLLGNSALDCSGKDEVDQCFEWSSIARLHIQSENDGDVVCHHYNWQAMTTDVILQDCYELGDDQWFGSANRFFQHWPINEWNESMTMYVSGDMYANYNDYGSTLERYWLSSQGVAVRASHDSPLHVSVNYDNDNLVCFRGEFGSSYYPNPDNDPAFLNYTICTGNDTRIVHDYMTARFVEKPTGLPDTRMMRSPIWSTWARFKTAVNQSLVLGFADEIISNGFNNSQIEIDDGYAGLNYGDFFFEPEKFPDPVAMIQELHDKNFRVTLWVTPFANWNTEAFTEGDENGYWVKNEDGTTAMIRWWAGLQAGMLDVTNPAAVTWFVNRLEEVRTVYGIDSFKFDAGETNYLGYHKTMEPIVNPCEYTTGWVKVAAQLGTQVEVRVGFETQNQPIFVRMMDKDSKWGWNNGLKTLITSALTFSVLGYPYVLADMIGGNVYEGGFRETYLPDKELFIRWLQITAFMPSMQYSISPWQYEDDPEVVNISRRWTSFHENIITPILIDLAETEAIPEGKPLIRPLWWIAPSDRDALISDDQFLVGDDILVAPIVQNGTFSRDVYLPAGQWLNAIDGNTYDGGQWLTNVQVPLEEALYYTRV